MSDEPVARLKVTRIPYLNTIVIKQVGGRFFVSTQDSVVIDVPGLSFLIKFLVMSDILSYRVLEGIVDEYKRSKDK